MSVPGPWGGSSPRVRGSPSRLDDDVAGRRFIPARAGEPVTGLRSVVPKTVHPRACGGASCPVAPGVGNPGSSPRVRGSRGGVEGPRGLPRFMPARAGEPAGAARLGALPPVHPRACGGAEARRKVLPFASGSSPRVRGSHAGHGAGDGLRGFIPARAGEPRGLLRWWGPPWVHPRACGGASARAGTWSGRPGSSPRVRGSRHLEHPRHDLQRFIPARAGEPRRRSEPRAPDTVHPRACGGAEEEGS